MRRTDRHHPRAGLALLAALLAPLAAPAGALAQCPEGFGDVTGPEEGLVDVADVVCVAHGALAAMVGQPPGSVPCAKKPSQAFDLSGDGRVTVLDVAICVQLALGLPLGPAIDANDNGCPDAFEVVCGDGVCETELGESCMGCPFDCGECPDLCCTPHDTPGCVEPAVQACVCAISDFCCEFFWDASCVDLALDYCDPQCEPPPCPIAGSLFCGQTLTSSTSIGVDLFTQYTCVAAQMPGLERIYRYTGGSIQGATFRLTPAAGADLRLFVLGASCEPASCITGGGLEASTAVGQGETVYVVVDSPAGAGGAYDLQVICVDDCDVPALCGGAECGVVACAGQQFPCGACDEGEVCVLGQCEEQLFEGCPGFGTCYAANGSAGCEDAACCALVCANDAFCCNVSWDAICASGALDTCNQPCGDGVCSPSQGEDCVSCPADCACGAGQDCLAGACVGCAPEVLCEGRCGPVFCGGTQVDCGGCDPGAYCTLASTCAPIPNCPGLGLCDKPQGTAGCASQPCCETVCAVDSFCCTQAWDMVCVQLGALNCDDFCGDGLCNPDAGEDCESCPGDCECDGGGVCEGGECVLVPPCEPELVCGAGVCGVVPCDGGTVSCGGCPLGPCLNNLCLVSTFGCPGAGDCFSSNGSPGCEDAPCCEATCLADSYCCLDTWDTLCVQQALLVCPAP